MLVSPLFLRNLCADRELLAFAEFAKFKAIFADGESLGSDSQTYLFLVFYFYYFKNSFCDRKGVLPAEMGSFIYNLGTKCVFACYVIVVKIKTVFKMAFKKRIFFCI